MPDRGEQLPDPVVPCAALAGRGAPRAARRSSRRWSGGDRATSTGPGRPSACRRRASRRRRLSSAGDLAPSMRHRRPPVGSISRSTSRATVDFPDRTRPRARGSRPARDRRSRRRRPRAPRRPARRSSALRTGKSFAEPVDRDERRASAPTGPAVARANSTVARAAERSKLSPARTHRTPPASASLHGGPRAPARPSQTGVRVWAPVGEAAADGPLVAGSGPAPGSP